MNGMARLNLLMVLLMILLVAQPLRAATVTLESANLTYVAGSGAVIVSPTAVLAGADFSSGSPLNITMAFTAGRVDGEDLLQIRATGTVTVSAGTVLVAGTPIGTYVGGTGSTSLVITIMPGATSANVETVLRHLAYHNLAGSGATAANRTIQFTVNDLAGAISATRVVAVGPGNAVPALTVGGTLAVPRTARFVIDPAALQATDAEDTPDLLVYELSSLPQSGNLLLATISGTTGDITGTVVLGGGLTTFTQADVNAGRLRYSHLGDPNTSTDGFTVLVRDSAGAATPPTAVSIAIIGGFANPVVTLPSGILTCIEQDVAQAMDPTAPATLNVAVVEANTRHYRRGEVVARLVNSSGSDVATSGDVISLSDATGITPSPTQAGYICLVGSDIYIRHTASTASLPTIAGVNPPDRLLGTIDAIDNGAAGRPLRIALALTVVEVTADHPLPNGDSLVSETEVVTPSAVAQLIAHLTFKYDGDAPPAAIRFLDVSVNEATPNTGVGSARRSVAVTPINDAPLFSPASQTLSAVVGVPLIAAVTASDPDLPSGTSLSYRLASAVPDLTLDAATGAFTWIPSTMTALMVDVIAQDDQGADSLPLHLTINPRAAPTAARPYVISDPLVEIGGGELIFHPFTMVPATGSGVPTSVMVTVVGEAPQGAMATEASLDHLSWTLTAPSVSRPASGIYTFGLYFEVTSSSGTDIGYQPITLVVNRISGSN